MKKYHRIKNRASIMKVVFVFSLILLSVSNLSAQANRKPNFIIMLCDDLGYGDIDVNGA